MKQQAGVVIGLVKSVKDPDNQGRIQVEFPWLSDKNQSAWAPLAVPLAGKRRGMFFLPEVGDEALVAFEHGDFDHPFIVGFLWNGVDLPPDPQIDTRVRRLWTVSGHIVDFDDRPAKEAITITTQGKQRIALHDNPAAIAIELRNSGHRVELKETEGTVTVATRLGQRAELNDLTGTITLRVAAGHQIMIAPTGIIASTGTTTIGVTPAGVTVTTPGLINVTCAAANVTASAAVNISTGAVLNVAAPLANFSGVLRANVIQAEAIVSPAYTPGIGNLFGL